MKTVTIAVLLMLIVVFFIGANAFMTKKATEELELALKGISFDKPFETTDKFCSVWEKHKEYFDLTINSSKLEKVSHGIEMLYASAESKSKTDFLLGVSTIRSAIDEILRNSSFDILNIL